MESAVITVGGGVAAFAGVGSPLTHAVGVGMNGPVTRADLDAIEAVYRQRGSTVNMDLCPLADPTLPELLGERGYRCVEFSNVMVRRLPVSVEFPDHRIERVASADAGVWSRTLAEGFFEHEPTAEELDVGLCLFHIEGAAAFLARVDGTPAAGGALAVHPDGLAILFADATVTGFRGKGIHSALIMMRLADASAQGAELATAATQPGSVSHRNYERCGFQVAYTKINMQLDG